MYSSQKSLTLAHIASVVGGVVQGDGDCLITGVASLQSAQLGQISFLSNPNYTKFLTQVKASAVIMKPELAADCPVHALLCDEPYLAYAKVAQLFAVEEFIPSGIHPTAVIAASASVSNTASIGPYVVIGPDCVIGEKVIIGANTHIAENVSIGAETRIWPNVSIYRAVSIGQRCLIHSGVVIGSDGFGMAQEAGQWLKIPQLGTVVIGDDVEIGSNTTIDRGALDNTVLSNGVKLDNQIQVGHNVCIGANTAIAGCVAIAGSAKIGANCAIGGGTCISGHLTITDNVMITGMSGVYTSIDKPGVYSSGTGVQESRLWLKNLIRLRQLDELAKKINKLEKMLTPAE